MRLWLALLGACVCVGLAVAADAPPASSGDGALRLQTVLREVLREQPSIVLAELAEAQQRIAEQDRQAMLDGQWGISLQNSEEKKPSTSPFGSNRTQVAVLALDASKPLENGAQISVSASYNRTRLRYPATTPGIFQATINPVYESAIDIVYRYPLWQGHGNLAYHQQARVDAGNEEAARWNVALQKETLLNQAVGAYFQLAANEIALGIARDAEHRAEQLLRYQRKRERFGLLESAERKQTEALLAARRASRVQAEAALHSSQTTLSRLLLRKGEHAPHAKLDDDDPLLQPPSQNDAQLLAMAEQRRPLFRMLRAQLAAAQAGEPILKDRLRPQLNLIGQIGSRALSAQGSQTFRNSFDLRDRYIGIGIELRDDIGQHATRAALARNALLRDQILLQRWQALEQVRTEIASARTDLYNARENHRAALQRVRAEREKYRAELARYAEGRADTATVIQFSGDLRNAELQAALQRIDIAWAAVRLRLAAGLLQQP